MISNLPGAGSGKSGTSEPLKQEAQGKYENKKSGSQ